MDVSVIIVNYNTKNLTRNCLESVFKNTTDLKFEVIISDNCSTDGSVEMIKIEFPQVILLENDSNLGFGAANNNGLKIAKGKYIFFLNSDTILLNNAIKLFFDHWENSPDSEKIGALGGILLDKELRPIHSGSDFPTYKSICVEQITKIGFHVVKSIFKFFHLQRAYLFFKSCIGQKMKKDFTLVEYITGADLFLRNNTDAVFDERFFLYYEETDLELNLMRKGLSLKLITEPQIVHLSRKNDKSFSITTFSDVHNQVSSISYARKNLRTKALFLSFLIKLDWMNPYIQQYVKKIMKKNKK